MTDEVNEVLKELDLRITKLEELIELTISKELYKNLFNEHKRLLNSQYSQILTSIKRELKQYEPKQLINLKKLILSNLPINEIHIDEYMKTLKRILLRNNIEINPIEIEIFMLKTGVLKDDKVCKTYIPEEQLRNFIHVL